MMDVIVIGSLILLVLFFGGITIWAGINMFRADRKPSRRPHVIAPSPVDPWGAMRMRQRERNSRPGGKTSIF